MSKKEIKMQYIRFSEDYNKNILIPATDSPYNYIKNKKSPHFISMMKYNQNQYTEWQKNKSLSGMHGSSTNRIWADFDSKDLKQAFLDAKVFVDRLFSLGFAEDEVQICFSGNKGIGLIVDTTEEFTIEQVGTICSKIAKDLKTFDTSMYDHQRIFRLPFTKNEKTDLYKVPITYEELCSMNIDEIKESAKDLSNFDQDTIQSYYKTSNVKFPKEYLEIPKKVEKKMNPVSTSGTPRHWKEYKWQILQGNFEVGERHNALMVLAATLRGINYDSGTARAMLEEADKKHCERTKDSPCEEIDYLIEQTYSDTWRGGQYSPKNNTWLKAYCERLGISEEVSSDQPLVKIGDVKSDFIDYVINIDKNTIKTGIERLDEAMPLTTGMICGLVGSASSGKTAMALKMLKNTSKAGITSVFASLDMHRTRLLEKLIYSNTELERDELYKKVQDGNSGNIFEKIAEDYKNVYFYDRSAASVAHIRKYIEQVQEETGEKVKFLLIDYFERLGSDKSEDTAASKEVAGALQDLCNDFNICIVVLVQPNKFAIGGGPDTPILSYTSIKGSSFLYQSFRSIISIWRPFFNPEWKHNDKFLQMAILKNDLGELDLFNFGWSGRKGDIWELTEEGEQELKDLIKRKKESSEQKKGDDWS